MSALTLSGNEITDAVRLAGVQGDGRAYPDSSFYIGPAATNIVTNGGFETNTTGWVAQGAGSAIARITTDFKFGSACLKITPGAGSTEKGAAFGGSAIAVSPSTTYTFGAWVKGTSGKLHKLTVNEYSAGPVYITTQRTTSVVADGTWKRLSFTFTTGAGTTLLDLFTVDGEDTTTDFFVDGVGLITGAVDIPYIETDGGTASRGASRVRLPKVAGLFTPTQGWWAACVEYGALLANIGTGRFAAWGDTGNDRLTMYTLSTGYVGMIRVGGGVGAQVNIATSPAIGDRAIVVGKWESGLHGVALNGSAFSTTAVTAVPTIAATTCDIGDYWDGASGWICSNYKWFACGSGTLTDADSPALNAFGATDPTPQQLFANLGAAARPTALWTADTADYSALLAVPPARITGPWRVWPTRRGRR